MSSKIVERFYRAFAERDVHGLLATLHPACVGHVSAGMPFGVGGRHEGPEAMMRVWLRVFQSYDVTPIPDSVLAQPVGDGDGRVVVHGWYEGVERASGAPVHAEFVHVLELEGERIVGLRQVTDTASWPSPAA
jgi:ketosteroid isomerase-like protein